MMKGGKRISMDKTLGRVHSIETFGSLDGPGIRYVLFLQGCPLRCVYCHNPDTWEKKSKFLMSSDEVIKDILKYKNFISHGGVTISGGEPLIQAKFCLEIINLCHDNNIKCAIDTSGAVMLSECKDVIDAADLILLDIKALDPDLCKKITRFSNENALKILDYCEQTKKDVWIRHVLVPTLTLDKKLLEELANFIAQFSCVKKVELLPFHKLGEYKWKEMGLKSICEDIREPTKEEIELANNIFKAKNIPL